MAFNYVKLNEDSLPKNLGVKGKNQDGIRYYTIDGVNMPSVTSILGSIPERKIKTCGILREEKNFFIKRLGVRQLVMC